MAQTPEFKDFVPGLEFFQTLLKGAGMPSQFATWVAPTMDVDEIERKITDLKAVLNWLEANSRMTQNMIQALEVQRMTLTALKTMNVDMQAFARGFTGEAAETPSPAAAPDARAGGQAAGQERDAPSSTASGNASPLLDPMQWWSAMTQQFTELAAQALQEDSTMGAGFGVPGAAAAATPSAGSQTTGRPAPAPEPVARKGAARRKTASAGAGQKNVRGTAAKAPAKRAGGTRPKTGAAVKTAD